MTEDEARRLLLVRAIEIEDGAAALLTREDRQQATVTGLAGGTADRRADRADEAFLARRAAFAFGRVATRFPAVDKAYRASRWPGWIGWGVPAAAFVLGLATNEISGGKRLNLVAFPLLGMLAWNVAVYLLLAAHSMGSLVRRGDDGHEPGRVLRAANWLTGLSRLRGDVHQPLGRALARFAADWMRYARPLTAARVRRTFHLGAVTFAVGVVAGMYLRALAIEYRAGWESTFLDAGAVHGLLALALGPASLLTGIALPDPAQLAALRWSAGSGENAGPWIHLYAATAGLLILVPRLLLAAGSGLTAARLRRRFPAPGREDFHVRRVLRAAHGETAEVRVVPYSYHPSEETRRKLGALIVAALGDGTRTRYDTPIAYGAEEEWLAGGAIGETEDHIVVLFSLSATPEAENHGALISGIHAAARQRGREAVLAVLVDESSYRERLGDQAGAEGRLAARRGAWTTMLAGHGAHPLFADIAHDDDPALVGRLEAALMQTPDLKPAKALR